MKTKRIGLVISLFILAACSIYAQNAKTILETIGIKEGTCLIVDTSEALALDLAEKSKLRIYLVNPDQKNVDAMRLKIDKAGKYGQITCRKEDLNNILYPTYFFDLVVVKSIKLDQDAFKEAYRLIKPGRAGIFIGCGDIGSLLKQLDAPCVKTTKIEKAGVLTILGKGYEHSNKYIKPPLTRLWVACEAQEKCNDGYAFTKSASLEMMKASQGEIVREQCMNNVPLDAYTGEKAVPEEKYAKSDYEQQPVPYIPYGLENGAKDSFGRHHSRFDALDPKTRKQAWSFFADFVYFGNCSPYRYANGRLYKSMMRNLLVIDATTGELLWQHRNGGHKCAGIRVARSILFQPNMLSFRIQAFISDIGWEKRIPKGDVLERGTDTSTLRTPDSALRTSSDWPMFHYDACRTGFSPDKTIKPPLKVLWKFKTGAKVRCSPVIVDGTVYVGSSDNKFYAFDAQTGKMKWRFYTDDEIHSSPCVWGNAVYFGCDDGKVYALDRNTGKLVWAYKTATKAPLTPLFGTNMPWFPSWKRKQWMETLKTDKEMQKVFSPSRSYSPLVFNGQPLSGPGVARSSPIVVDGILYVGTGLGENAEPCWGFLYALDAGTGKLVWKKGETDISERGEFAFGIANSPCHHKGQIHFSYGSYTAVDAKKGELLLKGGTLRTQATSSSFEKFPYAYSTQDGKRVNYASGSLFWRGMGSTPRGDVAIDTATQTVLVATGSQLFAVDMRSGKVKWEGRHPQRTIWGLVRRYNKPLGSRGNMSFHQPVCIVGKKAYLSGGNEIAVFDIQSGSSQTARPAGRGKYAIPNFNPWRQRAPWKLVEPESTLTGPNGLVMSAPATANGVIFAGSDDGSVYAWDLKTEKVAWKYQTGGMVRSSPAISRGRLYIGSDDGYVYCFSQ